MKLEVIYEDKDTTICRDPNSDELYFAEIKDGIRKYVRLDHTAFDSVIERILSSEESPDSLNDGS